MLVDRLISLLFSVTGAAVFVAIIFLILCIYFALKSQEKPIVSGREALIGFIGKIILISGEETPRIRIRGELWQVESNVPLQQNQLVKVIDIDELILIVQPINISPKGSHL